MARLLYRLGRGSASRPWAVIIGWFVALIAVGAAYLIWGGTLTTTFELPGTPTSKVSDQLKSQMPELDGASGMVVFQTKNGQAFTAAQQTEIGDVLTQVDKVDGVAGTVNPFTTQTQREQQSKQVADNKAKLAQGESQLNAAQQQLNDAEAQAKSAGLYESQVAQFQAQQDKLDESKDQLTAQTNQLNSAEQLLTDASSIRTVSTDGSTALGTIQFNDDLFNLSQGTKDDVASVLNAADIDGVTINYSAEIATSVSGIIGPTEIAGMVVAGVVLLIMLGTLIAAGLPLVSALVGAGIGVTGSLAFSAVVDMSNLTPVLGVMLGLAVGIDYSLFILNRHRRQLLAGMELKESIGLANGTSGNAVLFAGSTVVVALLALNAVGIPFLGVMGDVAAACVIIAVLVATTFTPALLGLLGTRILPKKARYWLSKRTDDDASRTADAPAGRAAAHADGESGSAPSSPGRKDRGPARPMRTSRAVITVVLAVAGLLVVAAPSLSMRLGLPDGSSEPVNSTQYKTYQTVADQFGAGFNGPLLVVADLPKPATEETLIPTEATIADTLMKQDDVAAVAPIATSQDQQTIAFQVVPKQGPSSQSTEDLVRDLRDLSPLTGNITLGVAGEASGNIDISEQLASVLPLYLLIVIGLSLLIMIVVFRSLLVPIIATLGFVLSLFAALGGVTAIYQWGWFGPIFGVHDPGPILSFLPTILIGVLFGLAMDYQLFLASGMREAYVHGLPARTAVVAGRRAGAVVVTAAAIIMASVFGGFVFSSLTMIRPMGFGLALGVLLDAFVVRMALMPAVMHFLGGAAWWLPKWLDRILPNVDLEGAALERTHEVHGVPASGANSSGAAEPEATDPQPVR